MTLKYKVINAVTGKVLLQNASDAQFDNWYNSHMQYRRVRNIEEVNPDLREMYLMTRDFQNIYYVTED